ncbi:MAG: hypothetical protein R3C05_08440 [Pirellulaceae bacterium]
MISLRRTKHPLHIQTLRRQVTSMQELQKVLEGCDRRTLCEHLAQVRQFLRQGETLTHPKILGLTGAVVYEAVRQVLGVTLYDVQQIAGIVLCHGAVAQMQTGEGKTLSGLMPTIAFALLGRGVHVATPNSYLATRDFQLLQPVIEHLGLTVGLLTEEISLSERRHAYDCDITYAPAYVYGFDYLRDQVALQQRRSPFLGHRVQQRLRGNFPETTLMQRGRKHAILDEIDHVLIDDALSPLVLSSNSNEVALDADIHQAAKVIAQTLTEGKDFGKSQGTSAMTLTPAGIQQVYADARYGGDARLQRAWHEYVQLALRAMHHFRRDVHYIVDHGKLKLIDAGTGRLFADRSWSDGQHQAVQCKENLLVTQQPVELARITRQRFFRMYDRLSGMTGTARGCADELQDVYKLPVIEVPLRFPNRRKRLPTIIARDADAKASQILAEAVQCHQRRQPVLIGTHSIQQSEQLARVFESHELPFRLLNGKQDAEEADIIAAAGRAGAITIATHLAGRGTDIKLDERARSGRSARDRRSVPSDRPNGPAVDWTFGKAGRSGKLPSLRCAG